MTREEFIDTLGDSLQGQVPAGTISSNLRYYRDYISEEMAKGRSEAEVLDGLGDPRLIARTIINAAEAGEGQQENSYEQNPYQQDTGDSWASKKSFSVSSWKLIFILVLIVVLIVILVSGMISLVVRILLSPVFWAAVLIYLVIRFFLSRT